MVESKESGCCGSGTGCKCMPIMVAIAIVCLLVGYFAAGMLMPKAVPVTATGQPAETGPTTEAVKGTVARYLNALTSAQPDAGIAVDVTGASKEKGMFKIDMNLKQNGTVVQQMNALVSPDGTTLFLYNAAYGIYVSYDMTQPVPKAAEPETPAPVEVVKSEKPTVDLFVMSHCPYGTQMEKAFLPVIEKLGSKVDFNVRFVYYSMHGEAEVKEELNQYCIQSGQRDKYMSYLGCFLKAGDGVTCLNETGIDMTALATCTANADKAFAIMANLQNQSAWISGRYPQFNADLALNQQYGVGGSPTLIINGVKSAAARTPAAVLEAICGAFTTAPAECNVTLSGTSPTPGFGFDASTTGAAATGSCG